MKIILTEEEAKNIISRYLIDHANVGHDTNDIEIRLSNVPYNTTEVKPPECLINDLLTIVRNIEDYTGSRKIAAIKAIRERATMWGIHIGLAQAKFFVENV